MVKANPVMEDFSHDLFLGKSLEANTLNIPNSKSLPNSKEPFLS